LFRQNLPVLAAGFLLLASISSWAATGGSISGSVADPSGAVFPGATLKLVNTAQQTAYQVVSDRQGLYSFPSLPVGHYDLTVEADGFTPERRTNLRVDTDSTLRVGVASEMPLLGGQLAGAKQPQHFQRQAENIRDRSIQL